MTFVTSLNPDDDRVFKISTAGSAGWLSKTKAHRFHSWNDFVRKCRDVPQLDFLLKYSTISEELFELAKVNYGIALPFALDVVKYIKDVRDADARLTTAQELKRFNLLVELKYNTHKVADRMKRKKSPVDGSKTEL